MKTNGAGSIGKGSSLTVRIGEQQESGGGRSCERVVDGRQFHVRQTLAQNSCHSMQQVISPKLYTNITSHSIHVGMSTQLYRHGQDW